VAAARAKKKIDDAYIAHVARELAKLVDERFDGNQTRAAKALGMSQPHLSHLIAGTSGRGPGLSVLILLRHYTNRSIDSLLGLPPLPSDEITERLRMTIETEIARIKRDAMQDAGRAKAPTPPAAPESRPVRKAPAR
jgi:transcriptional regulator with XRE-family HTH domain